MVHKLGERPTILDSHSDKVLKDFIDQKRDEKMYKKSDPIFRCTTPSTGKRFGEVVVGTLYIVYHIVLYQRRLLQISSLLMVLYTEISDQTFCTSFRLAFGQ